MMLHIKWLAAVLCVLASLAAQAQTAQKPKALVVCADSSPEGFDPGLWDTAGTANITSQIFQGLLGFERGGSSLKPLLASSWTVSSDARIFTFTLRKGVRFHSTPTFTPTREFNAQDVLFTFGRFLDAKHPFNLAFPAVFVYPQGLGLADMVQKLEALGDHAVRFTLHKPNVVFLSYLAVSFAGIQSAEYGDKLLREGRARSINNNPVGTGPYRFRSYKKDEAVRMEANPEYWGTPQKTQRLIFAIAREPNVRVQKLLAGECHISSPIRDIDINPLKARDNIVLQQVQALNISYLAFNMKRAPTNNRLVREALDIAVDRNAIFKAMFPRGDAMQAVSAFPPAVPGYNTTIKNEFNPARAKELLAQAGYANGFELDLWALPVARPTNPNGQLMAQLIQQDWAKIGVKARIKTYEWGEYLKRSKKGEHDVYMSGWSADTAHADEFLSPNLMCNVDPEGYKFCNAEFDKLVDQARATTDADSRNRLYVQAQEIFKRERPWITMAHSSIYVPMLRDVQGFKLAPSGGLDFEDVYRQ
jgi:ABC-type transport system substrate-binding protein